MQGMSGEKAEHTLFFANGFTSMRKFMNADLYSFDNLMFNTSVRPTNTYSRS